jgi:hypothetical protein
MLPIPGPKVLGSLDIRSLPTAAPGSFPTPALDGLPPSDPHPNIVVRTSAPLHNEHARIIGFDLLSAETPEERCMQGTYNAHSFLA